MLTMQIAVLTTLILVSFLILIGGYLYVRTQSIKERIQYSIQELESMNIENFEGRLQGTRSRNSNPNIQKYLDEILEEFRGLKTHDYLKLLDDLRKANKKLNFFWVNPFRDAKRILYPPEQVFKDYEYKKWWQFKRPFSYMITHIEYLQKLSANTMIKFINVQINYTKITQDPELDKRYLAIIKDEYRKYKDLVVSSNFRKVKESVNIKTLTETIDLDLKRIESVLESGRKLAIEEEFKKIKKDVIEYAEVVTLSIRSYELLEIEINRRISDIRKYSSEYKEFIYSLTPDLKKIMIQIQTNSKLLENALNKMRIELIRTYITKIEDNLKNLEGEIRKNVKSGILVEKSHDMMLKIARQIEIQDSEIASELAKYQSKTKEEIYQELKNDSEKIRNAAYSYDQFRRETYRKKTAWDVLTKQSEIKANYIRHIGTVKEKLLNIKTELDSIEDIREQIVHFNNAMLNIESLINELPEAISLKYNNRVNKGKKLVNVLINAAKEGQIGDRISQAAHNLQKEGGDLFTQIVTEGLLSIYVRKVILILNKNNESGKYTQKINRFKQMYQNDADFKQILYEAEPLLRKVKNNG